MAKIRVTGTSVEIEAPTGANLLGVLQDAAYPISTSCGGRASCGLCRLTVVSGKEQLNAISANELVHLGNVAKVIGLRLACQTTVQGEGVVEIDVPPFEDVVLRKRNKNRRNVAARPISRPTSEQNPTDPSSRSSRADAPPDNGRIEWRPRKLGGAPDRDRKG